MIFATFVLLIHVGELFGYRLSDGRWTLLQVISHDPDHGGIAPVWVLLDYVGDALCDPERATTFSRLVAELGASGAEITKS